ncbi:hypothetical protein XENOCAPTIV_019723, partial [Xenoophorus captivus]
VDITMLADHIMDPSAGRPKPTAGPEADSAKVGISSDVKSLSGYLDEVERFLKSKPHATSPKPNLLSGLEEQETPHTNQAPLSTFDWSSFLCAAMKEEKLKANSSCLAMTEAKQQELYETIRHALHSLRKHKYALYKRMTLAAILIQSRFRSFHEQRKFQQSRRAAVLIQQYYRSYKHSLRYFIWTHKYAVTRIA